MLSQSITSPNIALIKYWGKADPTLILPINDSISLTLNPSDLCTNTTISFSSSHPSTILFLNSHPHPISSRLSSILSSAKSLYLSSLSPPIPPSQHHLYNFQIRSQNNFPTASGLASSASGLASIAVALGRLFEGVLDEKKVGEMARLGSGSASRSVYGGLVRWRGVEEWPREKETTEKELKQMSEYCIAQQILPSQKLTQFKILILLATQSPKQTSSTIGMQRSLLTSHFLTLRNQQAKSRISTLLSSLSFSNISLFSQTIIRDSNSFHSICLDTYPPIHYLNQFSKQVMYFVDCLINQKVKNKIAYTFDAGPHAFLIVHESQWKEVFGWFMGVYRVKEEEINEKGREEMRRMKDEKWEKLGIQYPKGEVIRPVRVIVTDVGRGPLDKN